MWLYKYSNRLPDSFLSLTFLKAMPEAAGAVAAAAVADRLHGSKEDRKLAIVLVNYYTSVTAVNCFSSLV
jgi:hypothetical protein